MTLRSLERFVNEEEKDFTTDITSAVEALKARLISQRQSVSCYKPFYWSWPPCIERGGAKTEPAHDEMRLRSGGQCCFYHIVGAAQKHGKDMPLLPWQRLFWQMLHRHRRMWVKKARGIGLSTLMLYIIIYKCLTEFQPGDRVIVITGIRIETAMDLCRRLKSLFLKNFPGVYSELIKQKDTVCILSGVIVEFFPARTDSARGLDRVKMAWVDEADWFGPAESKAVRSVVEGFIGKPGSENMYLVLSSTPNKPLGLFETIEKEDPSIYYKMFLPYQYGLEGSHPIYDLDQIEKAKLSPDFGREYECAYLGSIGNVFSLQSILDCQKTEYDPKQVIPNCRVSVGIDPSFGSSQFGITATRFVDGKIQVIIAEEYSRPEFSDMLDRVWEIKRDYGISAVYVDAANPAIWSSLKKMFNEPYADSYVFEKLAYCRKHNLDPADYMRIVPTPFSIEGRKMLQNAKSLLEDPKQFILIHPMFDKLLISLRTAVATEYKLQKDQTSYNDILDSFMLSLQYYKRSK